MAGSVNKVILVGNLGRDPEVRFMNDGGKIVQLSLATSESWKDRQTGERRERTEWHRVVIFNENLANIAEQYCRKGTTLFIEGQLQTRKWTDQNGNDRYTTEIVLQRFRGELTLLGSRGGDNSSYNQESGGGYAQAAPTSAPKASSAAEPSWESPAKNIPSPVDDLDDEIPF